MSIELVRRLPYDHPYRWDGSLFGGSVLWRPDALGAPLALWLDAEDTASITLNGSTVSQWSDKSGNGANAAQATAVSQPAYSATGFNGLLPALTFDGVGDFMEVTGLPTISQPMSVFVVMNDYVGGTTDANLYRDNSNNAVGYRAGGGTTWSIFAGTALSSSAAYIVAPTMRHDVFNGASSEIRRDGTLYGAGNSGTRALVTSGGVLNIGAGTAASSPASVKMGEFLVFSGALTTDQTQKLEGYAAWKWGLEANLPAGHPYKTIPPTR